MPLSLASPKSDRLHVFALAALLHAVGFPRKHQTWTATGSSIMATNSMSMSLESRSDDDSSSAKSSSSSSTSGRSSSSKSSSDSARSSHKKGNCSEAWLKQVARQSDMSWIPEDALRYKVQLPACIAATPESQEPVSLDSVLFVVMASKDKQARAQAMQDTWMHWVNKENVVILSEGQIPGLKTTQIPGLPVDSYIQQEVPKPDNYTAANLRHLRAVWWLGRSLAVQQYSWLFLVDDDTFVNVPLLLMFLRGIPTHLPLLFGKLWTQKDAETPNGWVFPSGGAGVLFTRPGFQQVASVLFSPKCELADPPLNDHTIGKCCRPAGVAKVHSARFVSNRVMLSAPTVGNPSNRHDAAMAVTVHRTTTKQHAVLFTCTVAARYRWTHPLCGGSKADCGAACVTRLKQQQR